MSSRRWFLGTLAAALAGCGYEPVYGPEGSATGLRGAIEIDDPVDPEGFVLVQRLETRLGQASSPRFRLSAEIRVEDFGIGVLPDQTITRYNVEARVRYVLRKLESDDEVVSGEVANFSSYSATSTTVATTSARRDARERLMVTLADQIVAELISSSPEWLV